VDAGVAFIGAPHPARLRHRQIEWHVHVPSNMQRQIRREPRATVVPEIPARLSRCHSQRNKNIGFDGMKTASGGMGGLSGSIVNSGAVNTAASTGGNLIPFAHYVDQGRCP
jgi:hypothetical protein